MISFRAALLFLCLVIAHGGINAQEVAPSIHQAELAAHRDFMPLVLNKPGEIIQPVQARVASLTGEIYGYLPYWSSYAHLDYNLLTTIAYFGVEFDANGNVVARHGWPNNALINLAHSKGVRIELVAINFDGAQIHQILTDAPSRNRFMSNAIDEVKKGADGLNIDFELPYAGDRAAFSNFIGELGTRLRNAVPGSHLTMAITAVNWSNRFDRAALAKFCDFLFIMGYDYYWSGSTASGPVAPLSGGTYNVTRTVNEYVTETGLPQKVILGCPYYGYEWPTQTDQPLSTTLGTGSPRWYDSAESNAQTYGKLWYSSGQVPWYRFQTANWNQCFYDDSTSLSLKYNLAIGKGLAGVGMWALGYDESRPELWQALRAKFAGGIVLPPATPVDFWIKGIGESSAQVAVDGVAEASGYLFYHSLDGVNFDGGTFSSSPVYTATGLTVQVVHYYRVRSVNNAGQSEPTEVLAVGNGRGGLDGNLILVVNGFDRTTGTVNTRDFIRQHGSAILAAGWGFDSCNNDALMHRQLFMPSYFLVDWIAGEEGAATSSFEANEQAIVREFLQSQRRFLLSGSEIGYDLVEQGSQADKDFHRDILHAEYVADDAQTYRVAGVTGTFLEGLTIIEFDNGTHGGYDVDYPDVIKPTPDAQLVMTYDGVSSTIGGAAILSGSLSGAMVLYFGFPLEMIYNTAQRNAVMARALQLLFIVDAVDELPARLPSTLELLPNYPNPFNSQTTMTYRLSKSGQVRAALHNVLGQEVKIIVDDWQPAGEHRRQVHLIGLPSGVYFLRLQSGEEVRVQKWLLQK